MVKTISVQGYEFKVDFDYNPPEAAGRHYPGCSESVEINEVWDDDGDKVKDYAFDLLKDELEEGCLNQVYIEKEEAQMAKEEAKMEAWEARQELKFENWD
jgi:hypothetical protein